MRDNGQVIVRGEVLGVEHKSGIAKSGNSYAFDVVAVLTGKAVNEVMWAETPDLGPVPKEGERIAVEVELGTYAGRLQIDAKRTANVGGLRAAGAPAQ